MFELGRARAIRQLYHDLVFRYREEVFNNKNSMTKDDIADLFREHAKIWREWNKASITHSKYDFGKDGPNKDINERGVLFGNYCMNLVADMRNGMSQARLDEHKKVTKGWD